MLQLLAKVSGRLKRFDALKPQIELLVVNPEFADEVLDVGLKMLSGNPPTLDPDEGPSVLVSIAIEGQRFNKLADLYRWLIKRSPNPLAYRQLVTALSLINKFDEAEAAWNELIEKYPDERTSRNFALLAEVQSRPARTMRPWLRCVRP